MRHRDTVVGQGAKLVALCMREDLREKVAGALESTGSLKLFADSLEFERAAEHADVLIVAAPHFDEMDIKVLESARRRAPMAPLIVVTTRDADSARLLLHLEIDELVWTADLQRDLQQAISSASNRSFLLVVAKNAEHSRDLPLPARSAIAIACRRVKPFRTVGELADEAGLSRSAFEEMWRKVAPTGPTAKRFLDWLRLLRATARKTSRKSWETIALEAEVDVDTLSHLARRLIGRGLGSIDVSSIQEIRDVFRHDVLDRIGIAAPPNSIR